MWPFWPLDPSTRQACEKLGAFGQNKVGAQVKTCLM